MVHIKIAIGLTGGQGRAVLGMIELMRLSNRCLAVNPFLSLRRRCRVHGCLRGRHWSPHVGASRNEPSMWMTHFAETAVQPHQRNGSAHVPAGTPQALRF